MPTDVTKALNIDIGGDASGAVKATAAAVRGVDTLADRVRRFRTEQRESGDLAIERLFRSPDRAADFLFNLGPKVNIAEFAFRGLANAADLATEHLKKVREGGESAAEGILKVAEAIPILGSAVAAGRGLGGFFRELLGLDNPDEILARALDFERTLIERGKMMRDGAFRDRLLGLKGYEQEAEALAIEFERKKNDNVIAESKAAADEEKRIAQEKNALSVGFTGGPGDLAAKVASMEDQRRANLAALRKPFADETARLGREELVARHNLAEKQIKEQIEATDEAISGAFENAAKEDDARRKIADEREKRIFEIDRGLAEARHEARDAALRADQQDFQADLENILFKGDQRIAAIQQKGLEEVEAEKDRWEKLEIAGKRGLEEFFTATSTADQIKRLRDEEFRKKTEAEFGVQGIPKLLEEFQTRSTLALPTTFGLTSADSLTGVQGRFGTGEDPAKDTAKNTAEVPPLLEKAIKGIEDFTKALTNLQPKVAGI